MTREVRFAIVGTGMVADYHHQAILAQAPDGARLTAVAHHDPTQFAALGARFGVPCVPFEALLARDDVDALCLCTPSGLHAEQTLAAAQAGKHVLVEKPMALTLADADAMINACAAAGVQLGVALQRRVEPQFAAVRNAIVAGDLGALTLGVVSIPYVRQNAYYRQAAWRGTWALDGGGVLMNQGIHLIDLLLWYMGDPVVVAAEAQTLHRAVEVEDTLTALLRFASGAQATITATTTAAPGFPHRVEVYGTAGGVQLEGERIAAWQLAAPTAATVAPLVDQAPADAGAGADPRGIKPSGHINLIGQFMTAVRDAGPFAVNGVEGRRSLAAVLAIYAAAGVGPDEPS